MTGRKGAIESATATVGAESLQNINFLGGEAVSDPKLGEPAHIKGANLRRKSEMSSK